MEDNLNSSRLCCPGQRLWQHRDARNRACTTLQQPKLKSLGQDENDLPHCWTLFWGSPNCSYGRQLSVDSGEAIDYGEVIRGPLTRQAVEQWGCKIRVQRDRPVFWRFGECLLLSATGEIDHEKSKVLAEGAATFLQNPLGDIAHTTGFQWVERCD